MSKKTAKQILPFVLLAAVAIIAMFIKPVADFVPAADGPQYSNADIAWVLVSAALVFLMTPGLAFFYGGMVRVKSVLNMMMMSAITIAVVTVLWVVVGYSLTFGGDTGHVIGNFSEAGLSGLIAPEAVSGTIPTLAFVAFQLMFAIITPALISGAIADRATFRGWIAFVVGWTCLVYFPVAHSVWFLDDGNGGWIGDKLGAIDFAGGTAVHVNA